MHAQPVSRNRDAADNRGWKIAIPSRANTLAIEDWRLLENDVEVDVDVDVTLDHLTVVSEKIKCMMRPTERSVGRIRGDDLLSPLLRLR